MTITAEDIRTEHQAALAALTLQQRFALDRIERARRQCPFNNRSPAENLAGIIADEAERRNGAEILRAA